MNLDLNDYEIVNIDNIEYKNENTIMYDIEIEDNNTFFISKNKKDNILVHNCDGSHIKGLLLNLFDTFWPELLEQDFIYEFITPIVKIKKDNKEKFFYKLNDYKKWKSENDTKNWYIKYYKGLGTILPQESKNFFKDINKHLIRFNSSDIVNEREQFDMVFNKKRSDDRKNWLNNYKYNNEIDKFRIKQTYDSFINNELIEFSMADNLRSIPNVMDGLKPSQRKILYTLFKKNYKNEIKVNTLSGSVSEMTAYHHGNISIEGGIVGMAQNFIGSNNLNLLEPNGQFGTRLKGGKDSSASRYIFTKLNNLTRYIFIKEDDNILNYLNDDGYYIEPDFYVPIIPMILVNGSDGIGTGWKSDIPLYDINDITDYCINKLSYKSKNIELSPKYNNFKGEIIWDNDNNRYITRGIIKRVNSTIFNITELPIGMWNDKYYEFLDKLIENKKIKDYIKNCTDTNINITININETDINSNLYDFFNLETYLNLNNLYAFDINYNLKKFNSPYEIIDYFHDIRLNFYNKRKEDIISELEVEISILNNKIEFINNIISKKIILYNQPKINIELQLEKLNFLKIDKSYNYLLNMPVYSLTKEKILELNDKFNKNNESLLKLKTTSEKKMWLSDLKNLKKMLKI